MTMFRHDKRGGRLIKKVILEEVSGTNICCYSSAFHFREIPKERCTNGKKTGGMADFNFVCEGRDSI